jgi:hypothetical protein
MTSHSCTGITLTLDDVKLETAVMTTQINSCLLLQGRRNFGTFTISRA